MTIKTYIRNISTPTSSSTIINCKNASVKNIECVKAKGNKLMISVTIHFYNKIGHT